VIFCRLGASGVLRRFAVFLSVAQSILFLGHFILFETIVHAWGLRGGRTALAVALALLSISFLGASLLAFRHCNIAVRTLYKIGAVWLGTFNYLFMAACAWWLLYFSLTMAKVEFPPRELAAGLFGLALAISVYGVVNASWTRVKRITVRLPGLPGLWRGRTIALVSDLHLGNIRNARFTRRITKKIKRENPALVIIAGDLFDGTPLDAERAAAPLRELQAPLGAFFAEGNHEEFSNPAPFLEAVRKAGVRVLNNEVADIDGLQLIGVRYRDATHAEHFRGVLAQLRIDRARASILITHAPDCPPVAAEAGISLQVSGHTHLGQMFPYTLIAARIYRQFVYGLNRIGGLQVYTSSGVGTWGPPLRVGSQSEMVVIRLD
jgi:predicted MPP superfamily phosphohydrolase